MSLQADRTGGRTIIGMEHFAGLDVSVKETSVCIVDDTGRIVREAKVASEPEALLAVLNIYSALGEANLPVVCVETRHMRGGD